jgi:hypothetical protein
MIGVDNQASKTLPTNVLGTAPGNTKWSYLRSSSISNMASSDIPAHVRKSPRADAVHQDVVGCMEIEAFFDLGVRSEKDMHPSRSENQLVEQHVRVHRRRLGGRNTRGNPTISFLLRP